MTKTEFDEEKLCYFTNHQDTPLHYASENGNLEIVMYLIEKGANIEEKSIEEYTPLMYASMNGHLEVVKYLIEKGADVNAKGYIR